MTDDPLLRLAERAGVAPRWRDVHGDWHEVAPKTLHAVLAALGLPAATAADLEASLAVVDKGSTTLPPLVTAEAGRPVAFSVAPALFRLVLEDGTLREGMAEDRDGASVLPAIDVPGYHRLTLGAQETVLAVAPRRCLTVADASPGTRLWLLAVQLYALRRPGDAGLGDFGALQDLIGPAAAHGAAGVAISPVHAQFSADPDRFSPYSPSSRMLLNVLHTRLDVPPDAETLRLEAADFVEWPAAARKRLSALRTLFDAATPAMRDELAAYRTEQGDTLETHARFEALHAHHFHADPTRWHWRDWPEQYRDPSNPAVAEFAAAHATEVAFHAFMQWQANLSMAAAQQAARDAGMPIGLVADLAVGADSGGSHCWSRQAETLLGLSVGAPPDLLSPQGQNWGLAAFSPRGLLLNGFGAYLEMLRSTMRHAGGVRIDHALGLARLWVVPDGSSAADGAYISFPIDDMLLLIALESHRHRAIVLAEDLGTIPDGFQNRLEQAGMLGMRVLWFEKHNDRFTSPRIWTKGATAMTSTHDLPTVAGWWAGRDLEWRGRLGLLGDEANQRHEQHLRARDRSALWDTMLDSGAAQADLPAPDQSDRIADAAARHIGGAACDLAVLPIEDALALPEQPNLPGTLDEHPNWRRRLSGTAGALLDTPAVTARLAGLADARKPK
jgi:4-alpha-glucanotransferase